jgi:hypothetical protein
VAKSLFEFGRAIENGAKTEQSAAEMRAEVERFDLAGTGGFLSAVKYLVFAILASLNFHLFYTHVPGIWGVGLGCVALLFEACAVYFWNKQNRSAGAHKTALQGFAVLLPRPASFTAARRSTSSPESVRHSRSPSTTTANISPSRCSSG